MTNKIIKGSGGGSSSPPPPERAPDTLNSRQFANILDLLSEGEIEGFATPSKAEISRSNAAYRNAALKDVFLNGTPVLRSTANNSSPSTADFNFQNVGFRVRFGTSNQKFLQGLETNSGNTRVINAPVQNTDAATVWEASKAYTAGNIVRPANNEDREKFVFRCTTGGTSGGSEPTAFGTATLGQTISDNQVTWVTQFAGLNGAVTRRIESTSDADAAKITITFNQIQRATDNGDLLGSTVKVAIQIQYQNGGYALAMPIDTITGRTADAYSKEYRIAFDQDKKDAGTAFPIDIRVIRVTPDSTSDQLRDDFKWAILGELVDDRQRYLNSAYTFLRLDSEQFSSIPKRSFRIRGVKVRIPGAGSNVVTAAYSQAAFNVTVGNNNHGLSVGDKIFFNPTSGNGVQGTYTILLVENANSFVFQSGTSQTVGVSTCTYTAIPRVDIQTGRIIYPNGYIFNGTMGAAQWCSCPSMILLDLLTTERYGFGTHITDSNLDLFSFVQASRYANGLVDDGFGGEEARFSCNVNLQGSMEAYQLINELAGVMRCFPIWSEGSVTITQDAPTDSSYLFTLANVGEGGFSYSGSSLKQRHSIISVSYFNMDSQEIDYEVVGDDTSGPDALQEDIDRQAKLGIVKKDIKAFACTSRGQARRLGKAVLLSEESESEVVTFTTSIEAGAIVRPGAVISISDPVKQGLRRSGRIASATRTVINVDNNQDLANFGGANQQVSVVMPNGTVEQKPCTVDVTNSRIDLTVANQLSVAPNANSIWLLQSDKDGESAQTFRVISIEEQDGINYAVTALIHRPEKYAAIDSMGGVTLPPRSISLLNEPKDPPSNLRVQNAQGESKEFIVVINNLAVSKLLLTWVPVTGVTQYLVQYRFKNTNWVSEVVFRPDFELHTEAGRYEFKVYSFNAALKLSRTSSDLVFDAVGKTTPPADVKNLSMEPITNKLVRLRWTQAVDPDVLHGGRVYIRHSNLTDGTGTFQNSVDLITALPGNSTDAIVPSLEGEYILKFQDDQGNFSVGEASVIMDLPDLIDTQVILEDREDLETPAKFPGNKVNTTFSDANATPPGTDALQLSNPAIVRTGTYIQNNGNANVAGTLITITSTSHGIAVGEVLQFNFSNGQAESGLFTVATVPNANTLTITSTKSLDTSGNVSIDRGLRGVYEFDDVIDLTAVFSLDLRRVLRSVGFNVGTDIETLIPNDPPELGGPADGGFDNYALDGNFDGPAANGTNCQIQVATSNTASGSFNDFTNFANGTFKGRRFKFRLLLETTNTTQNMNVQQAGYFAEFQSRTEQSYRTGNNTTSTLPQNSTTNALGIDVTFAHPFFTGVNGLGGLHQFKPSVGITIMGAAGGEYFVIKTDSNGDFLNAAGNVVTGTGFNIRVLDSNDNPVNKKFTFQAVGYGKGV